jgi:hypothetical protein
MGIRIPPVSPHSKRSDTVTFAYISICNCPAEWARRTTLADNLKGDGAMAKIPGTKYSDAFTAVRHKVEMFVSPNAHGMYYRPVVGPGVGGDNCARSCAVVCRGEWGRQRALHPNAARGYGSRLCTREHRHYQVPVLLSDFFSIWEDFMRGDAPAEDFVLRSHSRGLLRV